MDTDIRTETQETVRPHRSERYERRARLVRVGLMVAAVTILAAGLRFYHLSRPSDYVFDEVYYAKDGCFDAGIPFERCGLEDPGEQTFTVHPPLGRELIALGIDGFGNHSFGWRVAAAVAGTASVAFTAVLALRLFGSIVWAGAAGLLLATEHLNFVQSRISMLDIFVAAFVVMGFLFLVLDRQWIERRTPKPDPIRQDEVEDAALLRMPADRPPSPLFRPWRIAAGIALGAALATKWSGGTALVAAILLSLAWERSRRARTDVRRPLWEAFRAEAFGIFLFLVVLPLLAYVASYARWWGDNGLSLASLGDLWRVQVGMADFSIHLRATHPYSSRPWTWLLMARPVAYYYKGGMPEGTAAQILGMGNPAIFWGSLVALPVAAYGWIRRRDWRPGLIVVAFAVQYLPWFITGRTSFLFYMTPVTPFLVLAVVYALKRLADARLGAAGTRPFTPLAGLGVAAAVLLFAFFFPVLTGRTISQAEWGDRMWFGCGAEETCLFNWV